MNDPHVEELIYYVETGEELEIIDPPPVEEETDEFRMKLDDDIAMFYMKKHYPTEQSAREPVEAYARAWELHVALLYGHKRKLRFAFKRSNIIDRDPPPPPPPGTPRIHQVEVTSNLGIAAHATAVPQLRRYPEPPNKFAASTDAVAMWTQYEEYLEGRDRLLPMAYSCLTRLQFRAGGRKAAGKMYSVDYTVLNKLGELTNNLGDEVGTRKLTGQSKLRQPTPQEVAWIEAVLKCFIRRVGEYDADPYEQWPLIMMGDLPPL